MKSCLFALSLAMFLLPASAVKAAPFKDVLAPHKALYDIKLTGTKSGSQVINIKGQMLYEWQATCDGWISNHKFNIRYEYADADPMTVTSDFSTYEPFDGKSIDFTSQRKRDGEVFEELRGHASLDDKGAGEADFATPEDLEYELPAGTKFPAAHTKAVLDQIAKGRNFINAVVFDGGDDGGPVEVNAFIGKKDVVPAWLKDAKGIDKNLLTPDPHRVRMAFFPLKSENESSDYEMSVLLHDNGIISDMNIDYDDFSVSQKLVALEPLKTQCKQ